MSSDGGVGGWWMASDGRWYPPEQHPSRQAKAAQKPPVTPPPSTRPPVRPDDPNQWAASPAPALPAAAVSPYYAGSSDPRGRRGGSGSRVWPFVVVVVVVVLGVVGAMAYVTFKGNDSPATLPHVTVPKLPTVSTPTTSVGGQPLSASPAPAAGAAPAPVNTQGCTHDPSGACITSGQPCPSSWAGTNETGGGGNFVCEERKAISDGGGALPLGYFWQPA